MPDVPVDGLRLPALQRARRTVVVVDMVESVRLMEANPEALLVARLTVTAAVVVP